MLETFLIQPFFAVILTTISCSLLGVFVLWKKFSYFGDALSHAILLGLILGSFFEINQIPILIIFAFLFAFLVSILSNQRYFSKDIIVMISSYFCIALAIILNDIWIKNFDFTSYIFGDVLAVGSQELQALSLIAILTVSYVIFSFKKILLTNINEDLAKISGIKTEFWNLTFLILLAVVIALSVRITGVFLMTALLILPAAIARIFSTSAKQMAILSLIIGIGVSSFSFNVASHFDLTVSSAIIAIFCVIFFLSCALKKLFLHEKS